MASNWAIAIGINQYRFLQPLKYAKRDAEVMSAFLTEQVKCDRIFLFTDDSPPIGGKPTEPFRANLLRVLRQIFEKPFMKDGDNFWFFFSGHGIRHCEQDYLMPLDGDPEDVENTGIPTYLITNYLRSCGADNVVLILDACRNVGRRCGEGIGRQTEAEARQTGVISIFSCSPDQYSYELDAIGQGAFTHALIEGLGIRGRCATVERLNQYLENRVPDLVSQHLERMRQTPYIIAEPLRRSHLILMPQHASLADIATLKNDAYRAQTDENWNLAEQLWIRVLAAASGQDADAIGALQRIAVKRNTKSVSTPADESSNRAVQGQLQPPSSLSPINSAKEEMAQRSQQPVSPLSANPVYRWKPSFTRRKFLSGLEGIVVSPTSEQKFFFTLKSDEQEGKFQKGTSKQFTSSRTTWTEGQRFSSSLLQDRDDSLSEESQLGGVRLIPWRIIAASLLGYVITGSLLAFTSTSIWALAVAGILVVVLVTAGASGEGSRFVVILAVALAWNTALSTEAWTLTTSGFWSSVGLVAAVFVVAGITVALIVAWAVAVAAAGEGLLKIFSKFQTFIVLAGIASGGLGLGWLIGVGLRLMGVEIPVGE